MVASEWNSFRIYCVEAMEKFDRNEIGMSEAFGMLNKYYDIEKPDDLVEFVWDIISEIDADHEGYLELLAMLKNGASEEQIREYMGEED